MFYHLFSTILILLIITGYSSERGRISPADYLYLSGWLIAFFLIVTIWNYYEKIKNKSKDEISIRSQSFFLILFFTILVYYLKLPSLLCPEVLTRKLPFLQDLFTLIFYFFMQSFIWILSSGKDSIYLSGQKNRKSFIREKMGLSLPALIPWFLISLLHDLLNLLPFSAFNTFFNSTKGQMLFFSLLFIMIFLFTPLLIQKLWACHPLPEGETRRLVEESLKKAKTRYKEILIWPLLGQKVLTAGIMGPWSRFRYILLTPALLRYLYPEALQAVIAHEAGHARHKHLFSYAFILAGFILSSLIFSETLYRLTMLVFFFLMPESSMLNSQHSLILANIALIFLFFLFYFRFIFAFFMRNFEREADAFAFKMQKTAEHLIYTFKFLAHISGQKPDKPNWHHFSLQERINFLEDCQKDIKTINLHKKRLKKGLALYLIYLFIVIISGVYLNLYGGVEKLKDNLKVLQVKSELEKQPENPLLLSCLADLYQKNKKDKKAYIYYKKAFELSPLNPEILNNMAWLYLNSRDKEIRDIQRGLQLAETAGKIKKDEPYILDTLAEAYYQIGEREKAINKAEKALLIQEKKGADTDYYKKQLKKFTKN